VKAIQLWQLPAGYYLNKDKAIHWDGRNDSGERVSSGIYFYQFKAGKVIKTSKMVILK
jgi:flagellar hook assembly protein FlgD